MSYQIFALKWRPKNFDEVIGQEHITTTLKNAILKKRLANAYLFSGPHGVGKTSTARILAKSLNCKNGPTLVPCQQCPSCVGISKSRSLDVIEIDGASNRGIDEIRALRENVKFSPTSSRSKVYIIDEVHMLTTEAFNALLKTLEEPPEFVKFIFATTQPHKVLPTILSRCQRFNFKRITLVKIMEQLKKIAKEEKIPIEEQVIFAIARASQGSLRDAESILDQLISFGKGRLSVDDVISVLGLVREGILFEITDKIIQKDARGTIELLNRVIDEGKDISVLLTNLIEHFRNLMVAKISKADQALIDLPQELCERLYQQSQAFSLEEIMQFFNLLAATQEMSKRLDSMRIPLEINLIKLAQVKIKTLDQKKSILKQQEKDHQIKSPVSVEEDVPKEIRHNSEPKESTLNIDHINNCWRKIIDSLKAVKMSVATYLDEGQPVELSNQVLTVLFPRNYSFHKEVLEKKENKSIIEKTIADLLNAKIRINFMLSEKEIHKEKFDNSPVVKSVLNIFNAKPMSE